MFAQVVPAETITFVERYGSFGVLVLLVAWFFWKGVPRIFSAFEKQGELYQIESAKAREAEREARKLDIAEREQHRKEAAERNEKHAQGLAAVTDVLSELVHFVKAKLGDDDRERYGVSSQIDPGDSGRFPKPRPPKK